MGFARRLGGSVDLVCLFRDRYCGLGFRVWGLGFQGAIPIDAIDLQRNKYFKASWGYTANNLLKRYMGLELGLLGSLRMLPWYLDLVSQKNLQTGFGVIRDFARRVELI